MPFLPAGHSQYSYSKAFGVFDPLAENPVYYMEQESHCVAKEDSSDHMTMEFIGSVSYWNTQHSKLDEVIKKKNLFKNIAELKNDHPRGW